jgi:AraC family transcriptional regulator
MDLTTSIVSGVSHNASWQFSSPVQKSSCGLAQFSFEQFECAPGRLLLRELPRNTVVVNLGDPLAISYSFDYQWQTFIASHDAIICVLPAGATLEMKWTQPLHMMAFTFDDPFATSAHARAFQPPLKWNATDELFAALARRAALVARAPWFSERIYVESLAITAVEQIARYHKGPEDYVKGRLAPQQLLQVITYAHDFMQADIGLVELANLVHLSPYHFGRLFKQTLGLSPYQYILQLRIEYAKKLIVEGSGPLGDIAYQLNFSDQAHFSNAFRKATGVSPRQYLQSQVRI